MGLKKSIMLSDQLVSFITTRHGGNDVEANGDIRWSSSINAGFADLSWLTRALCPDLSHRAWHLLLDAYAGHAFMDGSALESPFRLASDIMDHHGALSLESFDSDEAEAIKQIHQLSQPEQYAVYQVLRIFWSRSSQWSGSLEEIINQIKSTL